METFHSRALAEFDQVERRLGNDFAEAADSLRKLTSDEQKKLNRLLAKRIASHFWPFIIVEDKGFIELVDVIIETLCRVKVTIPKRSQLRGGIVSFAAELLFNVREDIQQFCEYYSIISDIWTARNGRATLLLLSIV
ncbi:hypothetical protein GN244_ATG09303 [Phytophthora infestans]|uniref:DUF659 domain-containing protein n=1 Tax=Phytophthora infestans TaxID=4787 RepID=A0A833SBC2_PHYIN|nr:hypothetical protein GN244_ATG09303 [Phytophthora infestans]